MLIVQRLTDDADKVEDVRELVKWLALKHPQLVYKPLFSLSAATSATTLTGALSTVARLTRLIGPTQFWTHADPQMIVIVLMGAATPKPAKGKEKEGETAIVTVRLGRYAVLLELISVLSHIDGPAGSGTRLRAFLEAIEQRFGAMLEAEETDGRLPDFYRTLACELWYAIRIKTNSLRRVAWQQAVLRWYPQGLSAERSNESEILETLHSTCQSSKLAIPTDETPTDWDAGRDAHGRLLASPFPESISKLLVAVQGMLSIDDWVALLPSIWRRFGDYAPTIRHSAFLLTKCAEVIPGQTRSLVVSDISSPDVCTRRQALSKLALLYSWRSQVLSQRVISDRRGPMFHFGNRTLDFVMTDIGTAQWVRAADQQDAALQSFGRSLPMELRQRLMELGWSQDAANDSRTEAEQTPVTQLPSLAQQGDAAGGDRSPSPLRPLSRSASTGSAGSARTKKRRAVFAPTFAGLINEQATILRNETDGVVLQLSLELLHGVQRDDAPALIRTFTDGIDDFRVALTRLNSTLSTITPAFAFSALNAITGYLRNVLRSTPEFPLYSFALVTVSRLASHVSEISLRDIRKSKAEAVLLPASIHEEDGGFKLHRPWQQPALDVQTAQLLILLQILKTSSREVYLFKKMLSNLQIQSSAQSIHFARAWLLLVTQLFATVNRNYADRSELRHFLVNVAFILRRHSNDVLVVAHTMRIFMLCSARFRRVFASVGLTTILRPVYETYAAGHSAIRDCVEYAMRSFHRIHQDTLVYQACVTISEGDYDATAVYSLLSCLSKPNEAQSGVASGIRGLNDQEELSALVQMLSGPEVALSELGVTAGQRQADKAAAISLEDNFFPQTNIIRMLVTVIAANPATARAANFLRLFRGIVPCVTDSASKDLVRDAVEALGNVIGKNKIGDESAILAFHPGEENATLDWTRAKIEYVQLIEVYASSGGHLSPNATKRVLDMVLELLVKHAETVGPAAASILRQLAKTRLAAPRPIVFLRDISGLFRSFLATVDFSGLLDSITALSNRKDRPLDPETSEVIVTHYVAPSIRLLASASEENMAFVVPLRRSAVTLLSAAMFIPGDAMATVEQCQPNASLLATVVLPLCLMLDKPADPETIAIYEGIWIRLLRVVIPHSRQARVPLGNAKSTAVAQLLAMQVVKIIIVRAPEAISNVRGLWSYIAHHALRTAADANGRFAELGLIRPPPTAVDWLAWTLFELLALHPLPLMIHLRHRISSLLMQMRDSEARSPAGSPGEGPRSRVTSSPRARLHSRAPSAAQSPGHLRMPSAALSVPGDDDRLTPDMALSVRSGGHSRMPSQHLTPILGHARLPSAGRPSFADLSARRVSRPAWGTGTVSPRPDGSSSPGLAPPNAGLNLHYRFPSSAPAGVLSPGGRGGAIVHLLGSAQPQSQPPRLPGMSAGWGHGAAHGTTRGDARREALKATLVTPSLIRGARSAVRKVMLVFGHPVDVDEDEPPLRTWNAHDALVRPPLRYRLIAKDHADTQLVIAEQTRLLIEEEYAEVFAPPEAPQEPPAPAARHAPRKSAASGFGSVFSDSHEVYESLVSPVPEEAEGYDIEKAAMEYEERRLPILSVSPAMD